jgi:hypothetical protein
MAFVTVSDPRYTDVVLEESVALGNYYSRDVVSVNTDTATGTYTLGSVITRVKALDDSGAWKIVDAGADVLLANEYAILIGDDFEPSETVTFVAATPKSALLITRNARVKAAAVRAAVTGTFGAVSDANIASLGRLLALQNVLIEGSLTAIAP